MSSLKFKRLVIEFMMFNTSIPHKMGANRDLLNCWWLMRTGNMPEAIVE